MWLIIIFEIVLFSILLLIWVGSLYTFWLTLKHPPFVPTVNKKVIESINQILKEDEEIKVFCEPGSGMCGVSLELEKIRPDLEIIAIEYNFFIYSISRLRLGLKKSKIKLFWADFTKFNLEEYKSKKILIYCYLLPNLMKEADKCGQFKNSKVITLDFQIPDQKATKQILIGSTGFQKQLWEYNFNEQAS